VRARVLMLMLLMLMLLMLLLMLLLLLLMLLLLLLLLMLLLCQNAAHPSGFQAAVGWRVQLRSWACAMALTSLASRRSAGPRVHEAKPTSHRGNTSTSTAA